MRDERKSSHANIRRVYSRISGINVDDYTYRPAYLALIETTLWATIDSFLWMSANVAVIAAFLCITPFNYFAQKVARLLMWISGAHVAVLGENACLSAVSSMSPGLHFNYATKLCGSDDGTTGPNAHWPTIKQKLYHEKEFDFDLAEFFLHLSALTYESLPLINYVLKKYGEDVKAVRFGRDGCCIMAVYSIEMNFLVMTFKGTGPFDLTEWLTDFSMRKTQVKNSVLPGMVHTGFVSGFGFPQSDLLHKSRKIEIPITEPLTTMGSEENIAPVRGEQDPHTQPPHPGEKETCHAQQSYLSLKEFEKAYYRRVPRCEEAGDGRDAPSIRINALQHGISDIMTRDADKNEKRANRAVQHDFWVGCIYPHLMAIRSQFPPKQNPNMWITGHSLGAATATLFTASIVWRLCAAGHNSTVPHIFLDHFNLCGTYTFGTPRTGDTSYRNALEKLMHENSIEKMLKYMSIEREVTVDTDDDEPTRTSFEQYNNICNILDDGSVRNLVESDLIEESVGLIIEKIRSQDAKKTMDKYSEIKRLVRTARKMKAVASEEDAASVIDDIKEVIFDWHGKPAVAGNRNPRAQSPTKAENDIPKYDDLVKNSNLDINLPFPDPPKRKKQDRPYQFYRVINANDVVCSVPGGPLKNLGESLRRRKTRPLATQGTRENNRQAGQTLTDFQHLGLPVLLSFRGGPLRWKERDYGDYIRNMFREVTHSLPDLFSEDTTTFGARLMIVLTVLTGGGIGFIKDHAPSEYLINLNMARPRTGESLPPA